jgi:hypothetical protein
MLSGSFLCLTKLEAFKSRGNGDGRTSSDFEDIVFILDNRASVWKELANTPPHLCEYLQRTFGELAAHPYFDEWISVHLEPGTASGRLALIKKALHTFLQA